MKKPEIIYYRENALQSIIADAGTFSFLLFSFWVNYRFIGNNGWVAVLILLMFLAFATAKVNNKKTTFTNRQAMIDYLRGEK